jgi:hypothetical protein
MMNTLKFSKSDLQKESQIVPEETTRYFSSNSVFVWVKVNILYTEIMTVPNIRNLLLMRYM